VKAVIHLVGVEGGIPKSNASPIPIEEDQSSLLAAARDGDPEAIERLCREGWKPVYRSLARYTDSAAEAEDMTQEVFVRALRALPRFVDRGVPFTAYLLRIADNLARDRWRSRQLKVLSTAEVPDQPFTGPGPGDRIDHHDRRATLLDGLDQLALDQRMVLRMRFLEGRTTKEIAEITGRKSAAVRQIQARGLAALRNALGDNCGTSDRTRKGAQR
jgi:RNA polymerase sigma-70 factor (ECF subfamily)